MLRILEGLGVAIDQQGASVTLCAAKVDQATPDPRLFAQIRGSLTLMGPLLAPSHFRRGARLLAVMSMAAAASTLTSRSFTAWGHS